MSAAFFFESLKKGTRFKNDQFTQTYEKVNDHFFVDVEEPGNLLPSDLIYDDDRLEVVE